MFQRVESQVADVTLLARKRKEKFKVKSLHGLTLERVVLIVSFVSPSVALLLTQTTCRGER